MCDLHWWCLLKLEAIASVTTSKKFTPPDLPPSPHTDFCRSVSSAFNLRRRWSANNRQGKQTLYLSFHCVWHLDKGWVRWVLIDMAGEVPGPASSSSTSPFPWFPSILHLTQALRCLAMAAMLRAPVPLIQPVPLYHLAQAHWLHLYQTLPALPAWGSSWG